MSRFKIIYEPKGRALEYAKLAANLFIGCPHGCLYCYGPASMHKTKESFSIPKLRKNALENFEHDCSLMAATKDPRYVLLSFATDPYMPDSFEQGITREALKIALKYQIHIEICTKGGYRSKRDFDILACRPDLFRYGTTLTFSDETDREKWEPNAPSSWDRITMLTEAKIRGIPTWVSCEPPVFPDQTLELIRASHEYVDLFKVGKLNHISPPVPIDWRDFLHKVIRVLNELGASYYIKNDLWQYDQTVPQTRIGRR